MEYPPQLNPVQAWLLGYVDTPTLRDLVAGSAHGFAELSAAYGRALSDAAYAAELVAEAQRLLQPEAASSRRRRARQLAGRRTHEAVTGRVLITGDQAQALHVGARALEAEARQLDRAAPQLAKEARASAWDLTELLRGATVLPYREPDRLGRLLGPPPF